MKKITLREGDVARTISCMKSLLTDYKWYNTEAEKLEVVKSDPRIQKILQPIEKAEELDVSYMNFGRHNVITILSVLAKDSMVKTIITNTLNSEICYYLSDLVNLKSVILVKAKGWSDNKKAKIKPLTDIISANKTIDGAKNKVTENVLEHIALPLAKIVGEYTFDNDFFNNFTVKFHFQATDLDLIKMFHQKDEVHWDHYDLSEMGGESIFSKADF